MAGKVLITISGYQRLKAELNQLLKVERPEMTKTVAWAASNGDRSENADYKYGKKRLREIDRRVKFLLDRIDNAEVVVPEKQQFGHVAFGATVTVLDDDENKQSYSIVGVDEVDASMGKISWASPLGASLLKKEVGDYISFKTPRGERGVEILDISYLAIL